MQGYRDLVVWQKSMLFVVEIYRLTQKAFRKTRFTASPARSAGPPCR
jgi:hypothetical protein